MPKVICYEECPLSINNGCTASVIVIDTDGCHGEPEIKMEPVTSSNISHIGYREEDQKLRVRFANGNTYEYAGVPATIAQSLMTADSVGGFFNKNIRSQWPGTKLATG